jgi:hypothetical protein
MRFLLGLIALVVVPELCLAQSFYAIREKRSLIASFGTGSSTYYGELSNPGAVINYQPNINVGLQYFMNPRISVRTELNWFILEGSDTKASDLGRKIRNLSFKDNCFEISATGTISLFSNGNRHYRRPSINLYGFAGIGLLYFNPKTEYKGQTYSLQPLKTEGVSYSLITPVVPFGLGARFKLGPNLNLVVEGGFRKTFTDYLDDVSSKYVDNASFTDPIAKALADRRQEYDPNLALASAGDKRGNPSTNDSYFLLNTKIEYYLPVNFQKRGKGLIANKRNRSMYRYKKGGGLRKR